MSIVGFVTAHPLEVISAWFSSATVAALFVAGGTWRRAPRVPRAPTRTGERTEFHQDIE